MIAISLSQRPITGELIVESANKAIEKYLKENNNRLEGAILRIQVVKHQEAPPKSIPQK